ncbi:putative codeine 3-O-demethylase [Rosa chinensis]|uniref:Putative codeine 3-O-demethylase n=1 Tax=Rosa chinensis TaxID=74649 RepID=A0A2P6RVA1_ROSCH|nr:protein SRG1 isoform X2 [Rosa chinensis]PRQ50343.1 putative codeine 3-O-demethylase [Rosa chinensis]
MVSSKPGSSFGPSHHDSGVSSIEKLITDDSVIEVPQNYVISDQESPVSDGTILATIPTIDMRQLVLINQSANKDELEKLHSTCKEWGIFQLVNHGVSSALLDKVKQDLEAFFNLPLEEKMRYKVRPGDVEGYGTVVKSQDQKLDWGNRLYMFTNPRRKPHLFPELPTSLRNTLEWYMLELQRIARTLLGFMGKLLKMKMEEMEELFQDGLQSLRMTQYPPCPQPGLVGGLRPHSDGSGITILHQVNGVQGLQIKKDGAWFPVIFNHGAFVVNVGDILEILSDGLYKSIEHRVIVNPEKERISIAMFFMPKLESEIGPVTALRDPQKPPSPGKIGMEKFVENYFAHNLNGKTPLERIRTKDGEENTTA